MVTAVVGANWGDEGKGKITDMLADEADVVIRFQGGANAGHTIVNNYGKFALHTLPSGVFHQKITNIIGNGVALDLPLVMKELESITSKGVPSPKLMISDRCQVVMPYHKLFDQCEEERLGGHSYGSTKSGIAPFYSDKYAKIGFQVSELFEDEKVLRDKIADICPRKDAELVYLYHKDPLDQDEIYETLREYRDIVAPYVANVPEFLEKALKEGRNILLEGQLGTLKDPDHGIYPMVTSSSTLAAYGAIGAGIPPYAIERVIVVNKAYSSAVGAGEFVSELFGDEAEELRRRGGDGGEYGATTGRPRRVGWYDSVSVMRSTEKSQKNSRSLTDWQKQSLSIKCCRDGSATYAVSGITKIFLKTAGIILNLSNPRSAIRLPWYRTVPEGKILFTAGARCHKQRVIPRPVGLKRRMRYPCSARS